MKTALRVYTNAPQAICFFVFLLARWTAPLLGQVPAKKLLQPEEFKQWTELGTSNISNDGKWGYVHLFSENGPDTLKVFSTFNDRIFTLTHSITGAFNADSRWFTFKQNLRGVGILNLQSGIVKYIPDGQSFTFSENRKIMVVKLKSENYKHKNDLVIYRFEENDSLILKSVSDYKINDGGTEMLYVSDENSLPSINLLKLDSWKHTLVATTENGFKNLLWNEAGDAFFFIQNESVLCYGTTEGLNRLEKQSFEFLTAQGMQTGLFQPFFSKQGTHIFFYLKKNSKKIVSNDTLPSVQLWQGTDEWIYPRRQYLGNPKDWDMLFLWEPSNRKIKQIASSDKPIVVVTPNGDYALRYNTWEYEPLYQQFPTIDIYLRNLNSGEEKLLIEKQQSGIRNVQLSPSGKQICYFDGRDWINYNVESEKFTNVTAGINSIFYDNDSDRPEPSSAYGIVGWSKGDKALVFYDKFDIWSVSIDGKIKKRLTNGREEKTVYRTNEDLRTAFPHSRFPEFNGKEIDLSKDIMLSVERANKSFGYEVLKPNGKITDFAISLSKTSDLRKAKDCEKYIFTRQTGEIPPQVFAKSAEEKDAKLIFQSNSQYNNFKSGKRELITYNSGDWKNLNGILYYPDDYDSKIKYPMITKIYEMQSGRFFDYIVPTLNLRDGYNARNFTSAGYFVFEPDIKYRIGDPAISALECVTAAVKKVLDRGEIDKDRIGLIGHSYGGYETAFIIGHTNIFKAAVAGAPVTNMLSYYLSINSQIGLPQMWRIEKQQFRMGKSYFDDPEGYRRNSPIEYIKDINTPLMIWAGDQDTNINWQQSVEIYLALRRLKKEVNLYVYSGEAHDINTSENQIHLSGTVMDWFNDYL